MKNITPLSALKDNYIWMFLDFPSQNSWVVDPGDASPVIETLKKYKLKLNGILITHHHADHTGGIIDLAEYAGNIPIYAGHHSPIKQVTHRLKDGDSLTCLSTRFQIIEIPGHTLDHIAYYGDQSLFCGDTLFSAGCGRIFEGTPAQMYLSLSHLLNLPDETKIYCGHEYTLANLRFAQHVEPDNEDIQRKITQVTATLKKNGCTLPALLKEEKMINPFLRCTESTIIKAVEKYTKKTLGNPADIFHALREWKNNF